jgi:uncharacterized protein Yka (UPF0111/DUF47 family)
MREYINRCQLDAVRDADSASVATTATTIKVGTMPKMPPQDVPSTGQLATAGKEQRVSHHQRAPDAMQKEIFDGTLPCMNAVDAVATEIRSAAGQMHNNITVIGSKVDQLTRHLASDAKSIMEECIDIHEERNLAELQKEIIELLSEPGLSGEQRSQLMEELEALEDEEDKYHDAAYARQPMKGVADMERTLILGAVNKQEYLADTTKRQGCFGDQMQKLEHMQMVLKEKDQKARAVKKMYEATAVKINKVSDDLQKAQARVVLPSRLVLSTPRTLPAVPVAHQIPCWQPQKMLPPVLPVLCQQPQVQAQAQWLRS